jgi:putative transposase
MKGKRYSEEKIISILKEHESGIPVADLCRRHGVSEQSIYRWKTKFGGMEVSDAKRLRDLEDENRRLKRRVADLSLDTQMLEDVLAQKMVAPALRRRSVPAAFANRVISSGPTPTGSCWSRKPRSSPSTTACSAATTTAGAPPSMTGAITWPSSSASQAHCVTARHSPSCHRASSACGRY